MKATLSKLEIAIVLLVFAVCLAGALTVSPDLCPDEKARIPLTEWIFEHNSLPTGSEAETLIPGWGFSYALRPYLSALVGAFFMKVFSLFSRAESLMLLGSRMGSVLSVTVCCVYCLLLGHRLFRKRSSAVLMAAVVCFLPQVLFVGFFQNNDSLSLASVSMMLYYLACGYDDHFSLRSCIKLAVAFSVALLSYYSVYGWILMGVVFCVAAVLRDQAISRKGLFILRRGLLIAAVCLLLAGWFFIRNAVLHEGDFLGITSEFRMREKLSSQGMRMVAIDSPRAGGLSFSGFLRERGLVWLEVTVLSFIGVFGYMDQLMPIPWYFCYLAFFLAGLVLFIIGLHRRRLDQKGKLLAAAMLAACLITASLSLWQSYSRDFQPQGRYVNTIALLLAFMTARGADSVSFSRRSGDAGNEPFSPAVLLTVVWLLMCAVSLLFLMPRMLP